MSANVEDRFESGRAAPVATGSTRDTQPAWRPVLSHCLRATPESPLPSDFERAVMDTAAHVRFEGGCEAVLRAKCRWCAIGGGSLLTLALGLAVYLPSPWLASIPTALAVVTGWRWAIFSAAADELRAEPRR